MREPSLGWQDTKIQVEPTSLEQSKKEAQAFIDRFLILFHTVSGDASLQYKVGDGFFIDLKQGVITLDVKDFVKLKEGGLNPWQIVWSVCHEIAHFHDMRQEPKGMMKHFEYLEERARQLMPQAIEIIRRKHGEEIAKKMEGSLPTGGDTQKQPKTGLEAFLYKKLHLLYNVLDDMYVNRSLAERAMVFAPKGNAGSDVEHLYRTYLFPAKPNGAKDATQDASSVEDHVPDYTKLPKSHQFVYALLRERMVPTERVMVAPDVLEALEHYGSTAAKKLKLNLRGLIDDWTTPGANGTRYPERNPVWRYERVKEKVESVFLKFLMEDLENLPPPPPPEDPPGSGEGEGEGEGEGAVEKKGKKGAQKGEGSGKGKAPSMWDELDQKPEHMHGKTGAQAAEDMADQVEKKEEEKRNQEKTSAERHAEAEAAADTALCKEAQIDPASAEAYRSIERQIELYKRELAQAFEEFMRTIEERITSYLLTGFKTGKMDVAHFINKHAIDLAHEEELPMDMNLITSYARKECISRLAIYPNDFRVRLLVDGSGSMAMENGNRIDMARQVTVLLLEGLATFEATMNLRYRLQKPFHADTEIRVFKNGDLLVKPFKADDEAANGPAAKFNALAQIQAGGNTVDAPSFQAINSSLDEARTKKLQEGKAKEIVFYIADGGSETAEKSGALIASIQKKGVVCKGLLIGESSENEQQTFDGMLGPHGSHVPDVSQLAKVLLELFREEIRRTSVRVSPYEDVGADES